MGILATATAGCGSNSGEQATASGDVAVETSSLSKMEFIAQANKICKEERAQFDVEYASFLARIAKSRESEKAQTKEFAATILAPRYEDVVEGIENLGAPGGDEEQISVFLSALQNELDETSANPLRELNKLTPFTRSSKLATEYGLSICADTLS